MWGGEENVDDYIESHDLDDEDAAQVRASSLNRADILKHTPEWVFSKRYGKRLTEQALTRIAKCSHDPFCRQMARSVLAFPATPPWNESLEEAQDNGGEFIGFGAVLRWSEDDHTLTLLEALWDQAQQSGEGFELCGTHSQALGDAPALQQWLAQQATMLGHLRLLDNLIAGLAEFKPPVTGS